MKKRAKTFTISAVAEQFELHPQTLRLYEREGLLKPSRSEGNTRLYTDTDLERLEIILSLTRDLGVNLAGVEIILNMREKMDAMQREFERFFEYLQSHAEEFSHFTEPPPEAGALVPISRINRPVPGKASRCWWQVALTYSPTIRSSISESVLEERITMVMCAAPGFSQTASDRILMVRQFGCGTCILRVIHGRDARATFSN